MVVGGDAAGMVAARLSALQPSDANEWDEQLAELDSWPFLAIAALRDSLTQPLRPPERLCASTVNAAFNRLSAADDSNGASQRRWRAAVNKAALLSSRLVVERLLDEAAESRGIDPALLLGVAVELGPPVLAGRLPDMLHARLSTSAAAPGPLVDFVRTCCLHAADTGVSSAAVVQKVVGPLLARRAANGGTCALVAAAALLAVLPGVCADVDLVVALAALLSDRPRLPPPAIEAVLAAVEAIGPLPTAAVADAERAIAAAHWTARLSLQRLLPGAAPALPHSVERVLLGRAVLDDLPDAALAARSSAALAARMGAGVAAWAAQVDGLPFAIALVRSLCGGVAAERRRLLSVFVGRAVAEPARMLAVTLLAVLARLAGDGALPLETACDIASDVAAALHELQERADAAVFCAVCEAIGGPLARCAALPVLAVALARTLAGNTGAIEAAQRVPDALVSRTLLLHLEPSKEPSS